MTVQIDEMITNVDVVAASASEAASSHRSDSSAERERARQAAEHTARIARRTRAEGFDD